MFVFVLVIIINDIDMIFGTILMSNESVAPINGAISIANINDVSPIGLKMFENIY